MKTKILFLISAVMIIAGNSKSQTTGLSGTPAGGNACATSAGTTGTNSTYVGCGAGTSNGGARNTFLGDHCGFNDGDIPDNVGVGYQALYSLSIGNISTATYNVAIGNNALYTTDPTASSSNGWKNTAIGHNAGYYNSTGSYNFFGGYESGKNNTTGGGNVYTGSEAGYYNQTGNYNTISGYQAGGFGAGAANSFSNNSFYGYQAGYNHKATSENVAIGYQALYSQNYATAKNSYNVAVGNYALFTNTVNVNTNDGTYNTAVGNKALQLNTTGYWNTACGAGALLSNTSGNSNTAVGLNAATACTTSFYTTAIGGNALFLLKDGSYNTAVGYSALRSNVNGTENTASGVSALFSTTGDYNTAVGTNAGYYITTGDNNTAIGRSAGNSVTTGSNNTFLGKGADACAACSTNTNMTAIGYGAIVDATDKIVVGNSSMTAGAIGGYATTGWTTYSDGRYKTNIIENVPGLDFILKLRPVTYKVKARDIMYSFGLPDSIITPMMTELGNAFDKSEQKICTGFIAQEVDSVAGQIGYDFDGIYKPTNENELYSLGYAKFIVPLVRAVQEQQQMIDSLVRLISPAPQKRTGKADDNSSGDIGIPQKENVVSVELVSNPNPVLFQNEPNPFDNSTVIRYFLPENALNSFVVFHDEMGREIKRVELKDRGNGKIEALTINLAVGIYTYCLIVEDRIVETRKMFRNK